DPMKIGLKGGMKGGDVQRLQRTLMAAGHEIVQSEVKRSQFGQSTLAALRAFQSYHHLRPTRQVNRATLELLLELEQNITITINDPGGQHPPKTNPRRGLVHGKLTMDYRLPAGQIKVRLYSIGYGGAATKLTETTSDASGAYSLPYARTGTRPNIEIRA